MTVIGNPCSGPHTSPWAIASSASPARVRAASASTVTIVFTAGLMASILDKYTSRISRLEIVFARIAAVRSQALPNGRSTAPEACTAVDEGGFIGRLPKMLDN